MAQSVGVATRREFALYWVGFVTFVIGSVISLMTISGLLVDAVSYPCWYPIISPMLGLKEPPPSAEMLPYCINPTIAVVRFVFNFLSSLGVVGAGTYMMLNGKRR